MARPDDKYVGLSDAEALAEMRLDVTAINKYIYRMRGNTTDEDLVSKVTWMLEDITGMEGPDGSE